MAKTQEARERARARRLAVDAERIARDTQVEDAATDYFEGADRLTQLAVEVEQTEARMGQAVDRLIALGETQARVAALLEISTQEVKRLKSRPAGPDQAEPVEGEADQEE